MLTYLFCCLCIASFCISKCEIVELNVEGDLEFGDSNCIDTHDDCGFWASVGECDKNPRWMKPNCRRSCNTCEDDDSICSNDDPFCKAAKVAANIPKGSNSEGKARDVKLGECADRHSECPEWAGAGECEHNPGWMIVNCPQSCESCHLLDPKVRCKRENLNMSLSPAYEPGGMNAMFESLVERYHDKYGIEIVSTSPWIVTFDNFISDEEADALIATQKKWERSTDSGKANEFGEVGRVLSTGRTSSNSWCNHECESNPFVNHLLTKIEDVLGVPRDNYESFQVLRYDLGQKYVTHHDYGVEDVEKACGPRILTFFLYLSDVEEGGETRFPTLNISVKPKKGKALLWPSTLSDNPEIQDSRTMHEARPVIKGIKFAANSWIHLYNFAEANLWGCTGTFDEF